MIDIISFVRDKGLIDSELSQYQETGLRLLYGLPLSNQQQQIAEKALDVDSVPTCEFNEATFICGRRSGKSDRLAANIAVYEAVVGGHERHLAPGERGHIVLIAQDKRAARVLYRYILAKLEGSDLLAQLILDVRREEIDLTNNLTITIFPCSFRATRGFSIPVAILDEVAFFRVEGVNVDREVVNAIRPAQATFSRPKLVKISSPYSKVGELYRDYTERHSRTELLCFQASSWKMNPSISHDFLKAEYRKDFDYFSREYGARFTDSLSNAFSHDAVVSCVESGRFELAYRKGFRYAAGVDPAGGGRDEFALSICHLENEIVVQDCVRACRAKAPDAVVREMSKVLKRYRIRSVTGDRYSGEWVRSAFRNHGISYTVSKLTASETFLELLPKINSGTVELLDNRTQTHQILALERRRGRSGKDSLSHPTGGHDDRGVALAMSVLAAKKRTASFIGFVPIWNDTPEQAFERWTQAHRF